ncbi:conserved repeat domain protein [Methanosalsum zhilinae DSM 4017]|uniref:Conserved repeat domain protein n=1 Tax=Methanosalsum zhilinae (strain DSM 4017 / NBRC 107636 / OCM 62 / WeN5) TaxID=679901 RepID=F7XLB6_METZD|nr:hypothetical protein [Methanosalsum zhilinae]AEH60773.1 conserved repeat domain protein [Methanosalsum zhilinae DSM 4017]
MNRILIAASLILTLLILTVPASADTVVNLTKSNNPIFDGNIDIGVIYNGTTKTISVQYISDNTTYNPLGIDMFFYNLDNDVQNVSEAGWNRVGPKPATVAGFGWFESGKYQNPGGSGGITSPIIFTLENTFGVIPENDENNTFAVHIRFSDGQSAFVTDGTVEVVDDDDSSISIEKLTNGEDGPVLLAGSPVEWTYNVTNTGNVTLTNISVIDSEGVIVICPKDTLIPGEYMICTANGTAIEGFYNNTGYVYGEYNGFTVTASDTSSYIGVNASISIEKLTNGEDGPVLLAGSPVEWTYNVTNTGNVTLTNISVIDSEGVIVICPKDTLIPGEYMICTANGTAIEGFYNNTGYVYGEYNGLIVNSSDTSSYTGVNASISIEKLTNGEDDPVLLAGSPVEWTYNVTNTGNVTLTNISVIDSEGVIVICPKDTLIPGEYMICTANGTAIEGFYNNTGYVYGEYNGLIVNSSDTSSYTGVNASISIEKLINGEDANEPPGPVIHLGNTVVWTFNVTNTGTVKLTNITVVDDKLGLICEIDELKPGESKVCTVTGQASAKSQMNIATVTGWYEDMMVMDDDPAHYFGYRGGISIDAPTATGIITVMFVGLFILFYMKREKY